MIKKAIQATFNRIGYKILDTKTYERLKAKKRAKVDVYSKNNLLHNLFSIINVPNFKIQTIYDVGANKGTWTKECLDFFPKAKYLLFEPQKDLKNDIISLLPDQADISIFSIGLGDTDEKLKFTLHERDDSRSFLYNSEYAKNSGFEQIELPVNRLDTFIEQNKQPIPDLLKIDAEGFDIKVLQGAGKYLSNIEIVLIEVGIMNKMMPNSAKDVLNFMDDNGFRLFEITDLNRPFPNKILWLCEFVFIKKNGRIDNHYS
tara:strand:- start:28295 stop:29071 length:777 start_codon:yes stop_codon:yes gene_type:complete